MLLLILSAALTGNLQHTWVSNPMTPTHSESGSRNGELFVQIKTWAWGSGGWMAFDSSTASASLRAPLTATMPRWCPGALGSPRRLEGGSWISPWRPCRWA